MRRYQGRHREVDELEIGGTTVLIKPADMTDREFAKSVSNAVTHLAASRGRRFTTRTTPTGVKVKRVPTEAEAEAGIALAADDDL